MTNHDTSRNTGEPADPGVVFGQVIFRAVHVEFELKQSKKPSNDNEAFTFSTQLENRRGQLKDFTDDELLDRGRTSSTREGGFYPESESLLWEHQGLSCQSSAPASGSKESPQT